MKKRLKEIWLGGGIVLALTFTPVAFAIDGEGAADRDLVVKEAFDHSSGYEKAEIGEVEKETDHDLVSEKEGHEGHESLREDHESATGEAHESGMAEAHDGGLREPVDRTESR